MSERDRNAAEKEHPWIARTAERITREIEESVPLLERLGEAILFLGGHRLPEGHPLLEVACEAATLLTDAGYPLRVGRIDGVARAVVQGVEAAKKRAEVQGLLLSQRYRDEHDDEEPLLGLKVHQRSTERAAHRWLLTTRAACVVALPGGLGTIELLFSALGDAARQSARRRPVILVGARFWAPFLDRLSLASREGEPSLVEADDLESIIVVETAHELYDAIENVLPLKARRDQAEPPTFAAGGRVIANAQTQMTTPVGPPLAAWMQGDVIDGQHELSPAYQGRGEHDDQEIARVLPGWALRDLKDRQIAPHDVAWALRGRVNRDEILGLLKKMAGAQAFAFLYFAAPYCAYRRPATIARQMLLRWEDKSETLFERLNILARSRGLQNPDALKSWYMGIASRDLAAMGYAVMIIDAVDLLEAGHKIAIEQGAGGLGDIIDLSEKVVYQHKRVGGRSLGQHIKKAVKQLAGWPGTLGAPAGFSGVAQLDVRDNPHYGRFSDRMFSDLVGSLDLENVDRLHRLQVLLDDRMLVYDQQQCFLEAVRY